MNQFTIAPTSDTDIAVTAQQAEPELKAIKEQVDELYTRLMLIGAGNTEYLNEVWFRLEPCRDKLHALVYWIDLLRLKNLAIVLKRMLKDNENLNHIQIAELLNVDVKDVDSAWNYALERGLITRKLDV